MKDPKEPEGRGRSAQKRQARSVELLARRLAELPETEFARLPCDPALAKEIDLTRRTIGHSSRKRQIKHLAGLLRRDDEMRAAIESALDQQAVSHRQETLAFHELEVLRDRLCTKASFSSALQEVCATYPQIDEAKIARLAGSVHEHGDKRAAREIFRRLRAAAQPGDGH
ncbi:MAG: ribosome biogenesis factor YjgA [Desulfuromonadales bacterium]